MLRLKLTAEEGRQELTEPYNQALEQLKREHRFESYPRSVEHNIVHTVSDIFFKALRDCFRDVIAQLEHRVTKIDNMDTGHKKRCRSEYAVKTERLTILREQLADIEGLLGV